ncbi:MAG: permease-like cell division protein FtsX [Bacteroidia bacterium]
MLGLIAILLLNTRNLTNEVKENLGFQLILNDNAKDADIQKLQKTLDASDYVKSTEYTTKEEAAQKLQQDMGEDFLKFLGYNPLLASINVRLKADYANNDSINWIEKDMTSNQIVKEFVYHKSLINLVNENVNKLSLVILIFSGLLLFISLALIHNTIRLSIYSKRFLIKTMQLVGATQYFIRKPFVLTGIRHGVYAAGIALAMLAGVMYLAGKQFPDFIKMMDLKILGTLFIAVILMGIIISWISTSLAVRKYLRLKSDELYY